MISAVESLCKIIVKQGKATLGPAVNAVDKQTKLHAVLQQAFQKLYGYTSDPQGRSDLLRTRNARRGGICSAARRVHHLRQLGPHDLKYSRPGRNLRFRPLNTYNRNANYGPRVTKGEDAAQ